MKRTKESPKPLPQHDYALALRNAVSWLGDRYLLAQPVARSVEVLRNLSDSADGLYAAGGMSSRP